jgi:PPP family 3-phenylpropionic acid transporter
MRRSLSLRVYYLAAFAVGGLYVPFFPRWLEARGMLGVRLGVIAAAAPAMGIVAPTAVGVVADSLGLRGGLLQIACAGALLSFGSLTAAAVLGRPLDFGVLLVAAVAVAFFRSPMTFLADVTAIETARAGGTTYGGLRLWGSLGFLAAAILAARYVDVRDAVAFPAVASATLVAALLASLRLPRRVDLPRRADRQGVRELLALSEFRVFLAVVFLGQCAHAGYDLCFSLHLFDLGVPKITVGLAWGVGTACEVALMALASPLFRVFPPSSLLAFALGCASLRWVTIAIVRSPALLLALQPLHALSFGLTWLASVGYTSRRVPAQSLATAQGLFATAFGAGSASGMVLWGPTYHRGGGGAVFAAAAVVAACACGLASALDRRTTAARDRMASP